MDNTSIMILRDSNPYNTHNYNRYYSQGKGYNSTEILQV